MYPPNNRRVGLAGAGRSGALLSHGIIDVQGLGRLRDNDRKEAFDAGCESRHLCSTLFQALDMGSSRNARCPQGRRSVCIHSTVSK